MPPFVMNICGVSLNVLADITPGTKDEYLSCVVTVIL